MKSEVYVWVAEISVPLIPPDRDILDYAVYETRRNAVAGLKYMMRKWRDDIHGGEGRIRKMKVRGTGTTHQKKKGE